MGTGRRAITCAPHTMPISSPPAARASQAPRFCRALVIVSVFIRALWCHLNVSGVNHPALRWSRSTSCPEARGGPQKAQGIAAAADAVRGVHRRRAAKLRGPFRRRLDPRIADRAAERPLRFLWLAHSSGPVPRAAQAFRSRNAPPPSWPATQGWLTTERSRVNGPPAFPAKKACTTCSFSSASMLQVE